MIFGGRSKYNAWFLPLADIEKRKKLAKKVKSDFRG